MGITSAKIMERIRLGRLVEVGQVGINSERGSGQERDLVDGDQVRKNANGGTLVGDHVRKRKSGQKAGRDHYKLRILVEEDQVG
jgi:hypothetical protein